MAAYLRTEWQKHERDKHKVESKRRSVRGAAWHGHVVVAMEAWKHRQWLGRAEYQAGSESGKRTVVAQSRG